jgi:hypothetical protein
MAVIDFTGIGQVEVPDDITEEQIQELGDMLSKGRVRSAAASAGRSLQAGVGQAVSGARRAAEYARVPTQIPIGMGGFGMSDQTARNILDINQEIAKEQALEPERREARLAESPTYQLGQAITENASERFQPNPLYKGDFWTETIPTGAGQLPLLIGAGGVAGPLGAGAVYGAMAGEATVQEADSVLDQRIAEAMQIGDTALAARLERAKAGAKGDAFVAGATIGAVTEGTLGMAGRAIPAIRNATQLLGNNIAQKALVGAIREGYQEGSEQVLGNISAQQIYDPNRQWQEGLDTAVGAGVVLGGGMAVGTESFRPRLTEAKTQQVVNDLAPTSPNTALTLELMQDGLTVAQHSQSSSTRRLDTPAIDIEATQVMPETRQLSVSPESQMVVDETGQPATFTVPEQPVAPVVEPVPTAEPQVAPQPEVIPEAQARIEPEPSISETVPPIEEPQVPPVTPDTPGSEQINQARNDLKDAINELRSQGVTPSASIDPLINVVKAGTNYARKNAAAAWQRYFKSGGDLPKVVFGDWLKSRSGVNARTKDISYTTRDFWKSINEVYGINPTERALGLNKVPPQDYQAMDAYLKGENNGSSIDPRLVEHLDKMRSQIDSLSNYLIRNNLVDTKLEPVLEKNLGVYLTRSYRLFDDPEWTKNIPDDVRNNARNYLLSELQSDNPAATEQDADRLMRNMLEDWRGAGIDKLMRGGKLGSKDLSSFLRRKEIAPELRSLLGEYKDPIVNYARTMTKVARYIGDQEFLNDVRAKGLGKFLFESDQAPAGFNTQIAAEGSNVMAPLNGLRTSPEIAEAFTDYFNQEVTNNPFFKTWLAINAISKTSKTVFSWLTQARNIMSQPLFNVFNGDVSFGNYGQAFQTIFADIGVNNDAKWRENYKRYLKYGVVGDTTTANELRESLQDIGVRDITPDDFTGRSLRRNLRKVAIEAPQKAYQLSDELGKIVGFESRIKTLKKIHPEWSSEQVQQEAGKQIREEYPSYSMSPKMVQIARRQPFFGPFVTFYSEMIRTVANSLSRTRQYLYENNGNQAMRNEGLKRLAGHIAVMSAPFVVAALSRYMSGITKDDEEDMRTFLPDWSKNSSLLYLGRDEDGKVRYVNLSYLIPQSMFIDPFVAAMSNDEQGIRQKSVQVGMEFFQPLLSEGIFTAKMLDVARNQTPDGRRVFNPEAPFEQKSEDVLAHLYEGVEPGTLTRLRNRIIPALRGEETRTGVVPSIGSEVARELSGIAVEDFDYERALEFKARDFPKRQQDITKLFTGELYKKGSVTPGQMLSAYNNAEQQRFVLWSELANQAQAAVRQGVERDTVQRLLAANGVPKRDARLILNGSYRAYRPSEQVLERARDRNRPIPLAEINALATERDALRLSDDIPEPEPQPVSQWPRF